MVNITRYEDLLLEYNWTGDGKNGFTTQLPTTGISPDTNGIYTLNFAFITSQSDIIATGDYITSDEEYINFRSLHVNQIEATKIVLHQSVSHDYSYSAYFSDVANIDFASGSVASAELIIGNNDTQNSEFLDSQSNPDPTVAGYEIPWDTQVTWSEEQYGDIWLNEDYDPNQDSSVEWNDISLGSYALTAIMHEFGHALGLKGDNGLPTDIDNMKYTMMSYQPLLGMDPAGPGNSVLPSGLQLLDIAAIQGIYGLNFSTRSGDTTYSKTTAFTSTGPNDAFIYTIWDGNGSDEIDVSGYTNSQGAIVDLRQGEFSSVGYNALGGAAVDNLAIAYHAIIEDVVGTANADILIGNAWDNKLVGGDGNDRIFGDGASVALDSLVSQIKNSDVGFGSIPAEHESGSGAAAATDGSGDDVLQGGEGDDILYGGAGNDRYIYDLGDGKDIIIDSDSIDLYFGTSVDLSDVTISKNGDDFIWNFTDGGTVTIQDYYLSTTGSIDTITYDGGTQGNWLYANITGQTLNGVFGNDILIGSSGNDLIYDNGGSDYIHGGQGSDVIYAEGAGNKIIYGGDGDDFIYHDFPTIGPAIWPLWTTNIYGGSGNDYIEIINAGVINIDGGTGDDFIGSSTYLSTVDNQITVTDISGNDVYSLAPRTNHITDFSGNDSYFITMTANGTTLIDDRAGSDYIETYWKLLGVGSSGGQLVLNYTNQVNDDLVLGMQYKALASGSLSVIHEVTIKDHYAGNEIEFIKFTDVGFISLNSFVNSSTIYGTNGDDLSLQGTSSDDTIYALNGNDIVDGGAGNDNIFAGAGNDIIEGGSGDDSLHGDAGDDIFVYTSGLDTYEDSGDEDTIQFGSGVNVYDLTIADSGTDDTLITLNSGTDEILLQDNVHANTNLHFENLSFDNGLVLDFTDYSNWQWGTSAFELIIGDANDNTILGGAGNDNLKGKGGNDQIDGGDGNDKIWGGAGDDYIFGGLGLDTLRGESGNDTLVGSSDNDTLYGGADNDILNGGIGSGFDNLFGDAGDDILYATAGNDFLRGGTGSDTFIFDDITDFTGTAAATIKAGFDSNASGDNDVLDIMDIIDFNSSTDTLSNFVSLTDNGSNTTVSVDKDGTDTAFGWTTVAIIQGAAGEWTDAADMLAQNNLIVE